MNRVNLDNSQTIQRLSALKKKAATPTMYRTIGAMERKSFNASKEFGVLKSQFSFKHQPVQLHESAANDTSDYSKTM